MTRPRAREAHGACDFLRSRKAAAFTIPRTPLPGPPETRRRHPEGCGESRRGVRLHRLAGPCRQHDDQRGYAGEGRAGGPESQLCGQRPGAVDVWGRHQDAGLRHERLSRRTIRAHRPERGRRGQKPPHHAADQFVAHRHGGRTRIHRTARPATGFGRVARRLPNGKRVVPGAYRRLPGYSGLRRRIAGAVRRLAHPRLGRGAVRGLRSAWRRSGSDHSAAPSRSPPHRLSGVRRPLDRTGALSGISRRPAGQWAIC